MKIDPVIKRETLFVAAGAAVLATLEQAVFLCLHKWWLGVLFSTLLVGGVGVLHFFLLGLTVQHVMKIEGDAERRQFMKMSQMLRMLLPTAAVIVGALIPSAFDFWALLPPLLFTRLTLLVRGILLGRQAPPTEKNGGGKEEE
jgi:membrane protein required for beta-lactamase induction